MTDQRKYDKTLVDALRNTSQTVRAGKLLTTFKSVPDDDRPHTMDPRLYEIAKLKQVQKTKDSKTGWRLSHERNRPDKVTYDLTETSIHTEEFLVPVDDHLIDVFSFRRADDEKKTLPALVYLHGGNFIAGSVQFYERQMAFIAEQAHAAVFFPEYRLAPETPFPGAICDARATIDYLCSHADELGIDANRIMVAGDSAGGTLTCACLLLNKNHTIKEAFLLYPIADLRSADEREAYEWSYDFYPHLQAQDEVVRSRIDRFRNSLEDGSLAQLYLQGHDSSDPLASAVLASDSQLVCWPKVVICNAEFDYLRLDSEKLAARLAEIGSDVQLVTYGGCDHGFFDLIGTAPQAEEVALVIADELKAL